MSNLDNFNKSFSDFLTHVSEIIDSDLIKNIMNETTEDKIARVKKFNDNINTTTFLNYLSKNKIKLFSHKEKDTKVISESLFGTDLSLKKIFNNQEETIKLILWNDLKKILIDYNEYLIETGNLDLTKSAIIIDRIEKLKLGNNIDPKESIDKILNTKNLNDTTNDMINDIFNSFKNKIDSGSPNPFNSILEISQNITDKYKEKIENGDIKLDDLLKNMTNLPGMENMGNMVDMLSSNLNSIPKKEEPVIIDENFSTADIEQGVVKNNEGINLDVGKILKTMDSFKNMVNENNDGETNPNMPDLQKMMGIFNKLSTVEDPSKLSNIFENDLGIDINKFSSEISKMLKK
jgi:hypothetical protein